MTHDQQVEPQGPAGEPEAPVGPPAEADGGEGQADGGEGKADGGEGKADGEEGQAERGEDRTAQPDDDRAAQRLEQDLDELTAKAQKADEYLELAQRTKADFENYRKRAARDAATAQERGVVKLARELLPAVDNLDRALEAALAAGNGDELASGIKLVHADLIAALARFGIQPFSPAGEPFDPNCHEAVAQQPAEGAQPGTVLEVYQCGYRHGESVLRPARVVVAGVNDGEQA
jgi:molecular chaperone GrpE